MRKIGMVLLIVFLFTGLVACSASVKEREKEALSAAGGDKLIFSERMDIRLVYLHIVCKDNVPIIVTTIEGFFGGIEVSKITILNLNEIACVKK
jgi:hypothetical protein